MSIQKINKKTGLGLFILLIIFISFLFVFTPMSLKKIAQAVTGSYNRAPADSTVTVDDWNLLDEDFLLRDGANSMQGDLNMNGNKIINLGDGVNLTDAANIKNVDDAIAGAGVAGGKDMFTNWGSEDCPDGSTLLYGGVAFSSSYDSFSGGSNPICIQSGDAGGVMTPAFADKLYPLVTGADANLPTSDSDPQSTIAGGKIVKCALCHKATNACYEHYGSHNCATGFDPIYSGYVLGSYGTNGGDNHYNSTQRACVNRLFDDSQPANGNMGAMWYGSKIQSNFGLAYTESAFIKCSICCN